MLKHIFNKDDRPAPMSVYNGILRSYFLLGTKISFASNNDEKIVAHIYMFSYYPQSPAKMDFSVM